jgi:membrane-bound lytic murein transglycosylase F
LKAVRTISLCALLTTCHQAPTLLEQIVSEGELRVVTRNSPTTYYLGSEGPVGPEYDLVKSFAYYLGVELKIYPLDSFGEIIPEVTSGHAHMAAAGLTITEARSKILTFGPSYHTVSEELIYRNGRSKPDDLIDLYGKSIEVMADSSHAETLWGLQADHPELSWDEHPSADEQELIEMVSSGTLEYTVADSNSFDINRFFHPDIRVAFDLSPPQHIAWAFRKESDSTLVDKAQSFFDDGAATVVLNTIEERYYAHSDDGFDYVGARTFLKHIQSRLPLYRTMFQEAAASVGMDWRLLAAMGYQESHWDPQAVSATGVKGIMMLTHDTARSLGLVDRKDPLQSIQGGARYFERVMGKIPERITGLDRIWLALASYNIGYGHLEDARILTEIQGGDPDVWEDVRTSLPLLTQKKWYSRVKRGYARGWQPVHYVDNIRSYYEVLRWMTASMPQEPVQAESETEVDSELESEMDLETA